jgi:hypothetical protein
MTLNLTEIPPVPVILIIGGIIFLILAVVESMAGKVKVSAKRQKTSATIGSILIVLGLILYFVPSPNNPETSPTETPTATVSVLFATPTIHPSETPSTVNFTPSVEADLKSIVISEVLGNPCGQDSRNEYVELYNSGDNAVDIANLWITDGDEADLLTTWQSRLPSVNLGVAVKVDTTIIPPHGFAVILAPGYPFVTKGERIMSYEFADDTIILTLADGQLIGDENSGIEVVNRDGVVLYKGSDNKVEEVISSYGSLTFSGNPLSIKDDGLDKIPFFERWDDCWTVERITLINDDIASNWKVVPKSSPGYHSSQ